MFLLRHVLYTTLLAVASAEVYNRCSFARKLLELKVAHDDIPKLTCIAQRNSALRDNHHAGTGWGVFGISDGFWCHEADKPATSSCKVTCEELTKSTASSVSCVMMIKDVHGYAAWGASGDACVAQASTYLNGCDLDLSLSDKVSTSVGKVYDRCSFAQKLQELNVPQDDIPKLTCIAEKNSGLRDDHHAGTAWGVFGISNGVWCHEADEPPFSSCQVTCEELTTSTSSSVTCVMKIKGEQGYGAWGPAGQACVDSAPTYLSRCSLTPVTPTVRTTPRPTVVALSTNNNGPSCEVPQSPEGGRFVKFRGSTGDKVPVDSVLEIQCRANYTLVGNRYIRCLEDGSWEGLPECKRKCMLLRSRTTNVTCSLNDRDVGCTTFQDHGAIVTPTCKSGHINYNLISNKCDDGWWRYSFPRCTPTCGETPGIGVGYVINGKVAPRGLFPWHAVIYRIGGDDPSGYMQICGGTIVSNHFVVSAAHCFYDDVKKGINPPPESYLIGLGKSKRTAGDETNNPYIQNIEVKEIIIPVAYRGDSRNQQSDIALLLLSTEIEFTQFVLPICMSFDRSAERTFFTKKQTLARVPGNGLTSDGGQPSEELRYLDVPVIDRYKCEGEMPESFQKYLTNDKICAGYLNGSSVCNGDSGGGLVFQSSVHEKSKWYLLGIVSTGVPSDTYGTSSCKSNTYSSFTRMSDHGDWIQRHVDRLV